MPQDGFLLGFTVLVTPFSTIGKTPVTATALKVRADPTTGVTISMRKKKLVTVCNTGEVGNDRACDPIAITIPTILIEDGHEDLQWIAQAMDHCTANQLCELARASGILARIIPVQLILPAADAVGAVSNNLDAVTAEAVRIKLKTPTGV